MVAMQSKQPMAQPQEGVVGARAEFLTCVKSRTAKYQTLPSLAPQGVAFLVGVSCAPYREAYRQALADARLPDVPKLLEHIDSEVVAYVVMQASRAR